MPVCTTNNNVALLKNTNDDDHNNFDYSVDNTNNDTNNEADGIQKATTSLCPASCSVEKRAYYKELQRWSKNMLLMIGLENVAKKFSDKKSWAKFYYCYPFIDQRQQKKPNNNNNNSNVSEDQGDKQVSCQIQSDSGMCSDWEPDEPCFICMGKGKQTLKSSENQTRPLKAQSSTTTSIKSCSSSIPSVVDHHHHPRHNHSQKVGATTSSSSLGLEYLFGSLLTNGQSDATSSSVSDLATSMIASMMDPYQQAYYDLNRAYLNQLMLSWSKQMTQAYSMPSTSSVSSSTTASLLPYLTAAAAAVTSSSGAQRSQSMFMTSTSPQALSSPDLKPRSSQGSASFSIQNLVLVDRPSSTPKVDKKAKLADEPLDLTMGSKVPENNLQKALDTMTPSSNNANNNKKAYSQADLEAAVNDIRCGKLGTRRASVVYGIPRSTLRNKIYKLEATASTAASVATILTTGGGNGDDSSSASGSGTASGNLNKKKRKRDATDASIDRIMDDLTATVQRVASGAATPPPPKTPPVVDEEPASVAAAQHNLQTAAALWSAANGEASPNVLAAAAASIINTLGIRPENHHSSSSITSNQSLLDTAAVVSLTALAEQLKLAAASGGVKSPPVDVQQKKKVKRSSTSTPLTSTTARPASTASLSSDASNAAGVDDKFASDKSDICSDKKNRPKRGQYRRYDKSALAQAVLSVRKGEMSVHRAGSYYGVPHSTLEYKVKERNLLRPRKRDLLQQQKAAATTAAEQLKSPETVEENSSHDSTPKNF